MFRLVPPAGAPIGISDLISSCFQRFDSDLESKCEEVLCDMLSVKHIFFVNSGRTAQTMILKALKRIDNDNRDEVVVPAYTCYSVAASVVRAGLNVRPVDIDPHTFDYNYDKLKSVDFSKVIAINASNLFGIISDFDQLDSIAKENKVSLIDDAAQSFGLKLNEKNSGTLGRAGFYSLDRGKNLSTFSGGILVTNDDRLAELFKSEYEQFDQAGFISDMINAVKIAIVSILSKPILFKIPASMPFLGIGETIYDDSFSKEKLSPLQLALLKRMLPKLEKYNSHRKTITQKLLDYFSKNENYVIPQGRYGSASLRFPVLAKDRNTKDEIVEKLYKSGISASRMYPDMIANIKQISGHLALNPEEFEGAKTIVDTLFTLPTHPSVTDDDIKKIISCLN